MLQAKTKRKHPYNFFQTDGLANGSSDLEAYQLIHTLSLGKFIAWKNVYSQINYSSCANIQTGNGVSLYHNSLHSCHDLRCVCGGGIRIYC